MFRQAREQAQAAIVVPEAFTMYHRRQITGLAAKYRLPTIYGLLDFVDVGGFMAYGVDMSVVWQGTAVYVDKILRGAHPAELPIEQPTQFRLAVNLKAAKVTWADHPRVDPAACRRDNSMIRSGTPAFWGIWRSRSVRSVVGWKLWSRPDRQWRCILDLDWLRTARSRPSSVPLNSPESGRPKARPSPNHLVSPHQDRLGNSDAEGFGGLQVDDKLELGRLLDGQVAGLGPFQDLVHVACRSAEQIDGVRPVGHQSPFLGELPRPVHREEVALESPAWPALLDGN